MFPQGLGEHFFCRWQSESTRWGNSGATSYSFLYLIGEGDHSGIPATFLHQNKGLKVLQKVESFQVFKSFKSVRKSRKLTSEKLPKDVEDCVKDRPDSSELVRVDWFFGELRVCFVQDCTVVLTRTYQLK